jgi:hypothetical protein
MHCQLAHRKRRWSGDRVTAMMSHLRACMHDALSEVGGVAPLPLSGTAVTCNAQHAFMMQRAGIGCRPQVAGHVCRNALGSLHALRNLQLFTFI